MVPVTVAVFTPAPPSVKLNPEGRVLPCSENAISGVNVRVWEPEAVLFADNTIVPPFDVLSVVILATVVVPVAIPVPVTLSPTLTFVVVRLVTLVAPLVSTPVVAFPVGDAVSVIVPTLGFSSP